MFFGNEILNIIWQRRIELARQVGEHIQLTFSAMALAIIIGVVVGILLTRFRKLATSVMAVASVIQTIPSLALLALMIPLLGIGLAPAIAALFLYALLPILRNTYTAIDEVDPAVIEVGRGMGMTEWQILYKVEIPLCVPVVMAGIRTSTVICVGIATLCTFIGAGGLGTMIMEGMQSRGSALIIAGVIPAILLALALDGLMALCQKMLTPTGLKISASETKPKKKSKGLKKLLASLVVIIICLIISIPIFQYRKCDIVVGSKHFTEQKILCEIVSQLIEAKTELKVKTRKGLQGTKVCFNALKEGDIELYPEYTGTGLVNILGKDYNLSDRNLLGYLRKNFENKWQLSWSEPLGFNNTYAFAMRQNHAERLGIEKISDLKGHIDQLHFGFDHEYTMRPEYENFPEIYGFTFGDKITKLDPDLTYKAMKDGSVDVIDVFSTDGRIQAYNFRVLEDDKNLFPPYDACLLFRQDTLKKYPQLKNVFELLSGKIKPEQMRKMNYAVSEEKQSPSKAAEKYLKKQKLIKNKN
jgi:osmoprotectant transport system permease protein